MTEVAVGRQLTRKLHAEVTGVRTAVPNNCVARMMYYLGCVSSVSETASIPERYRDYDNYHRLSLEEKRYLLQLGRYYSINAMKASGDFVEVDSLLDNSGNEFIRFSTVDEITTALGLKQGSNELMTIKREVGNKQGLTSVMAFTESWGRFNYYNAV